MSVQTTRLSPTRAIEFRTEWRQAVTDLLREAGEWAGEQGWNVRETERKLNEEALGRNTVPALEIETGDGRGWMEPVARDVMGAVGRVDLYAWPSLYRVMLLRPADLTWVVRTESRIDWPNPWGPRTFVELVRRLLAAQ